MMLTSQILDLLIKTRLNQQQLILKRFNYRLCDSQSRLDLKEQARRAAAVSGKPIFIFRELINYLTTKRIIIPGYSFIQEVIGNAITYEQKRLIRIIQKQLSETDKQHLKNYYTILLAYIRLLKSNMNLKTLV